jgi:hypothetical protein
MLSKIFNRLFNIKVDIKNKDQQEATTFTESKIVHVDPEVNSLNQTTIIPDDNKKQEELNSKNNQSEDFSKATEEQSNVLGDATPLANDKHQINTLSSNIVSNVVVEATNNIINKHDQLQSASQQQVKNADYEKSDLESDIKLKTTTDDSKYLSKLDTKNTHEPGAKNNQPQGNAAADTAYPENNALNSSANKTFDNQLQNPLNQAIVYSDIALSSKFNNETQSNNGNLVGKQDQANVAAATAIAANQQEQTNNSKHTPDAADAAPNTSKTPPPPPPQSNEHTTSPGSGNNKNGQIENINTSISSTDLTENVDSLEADDGNNSNPQKTDELDVKNNQPQENVVAATVPSENNVLNSSASENQSQNPRVQAIVSSDIGPPSENEGFNNETQSNNGNLVGKQDQANVAAATAIAANQQEQTNNSKPTSDAASNISETPPPPQIQKPIKQLQPQKSINKRNDTDAADTSAAISATQIPTPISDTKNSNEKPDSDSVTNHDDVYLEDISAPVSAAISKNIIPGQESASIPAAIAALTQQSDTPPVAETEQNIPVLPPDLEVQPTNVDNSAAITAAIAAAVSQLLKTNPELISPTQTDKNQHLIVSDKTQKPNVNASAPIASPISAAIKPQPPRLDEQIITSNNIINAEVVATNQGTSESQQKRQTTTIPTNNELLKSESGISTATAAAVAASVATAPAVDTTSAAISSTILSQTKVQPQQNLISSESNLNITPAVAAAIGAHLDQPAVSSLKNTSTDTRPINPSSQIIQQLQQQLEQLQQQLEQLQQQPQQQPQQQLEQLKQLKQLKQQLEQQLQQQQLQQQQLKQQQQQLKQQQQLQQQLQLQQLQLQQLQQQLEQQQLEQQQLHPTEIVTDNSQFKQTTNFKIHETDDANITINEIITPAVAAAIGAHLDQPTVSTLQGSFDTSIQNASSQIIQQQQPSTVIVPEDTQVLYNNLLYKIDPTTPSQFIETSHKKNTDTNEIEKRTRILKLVDGTTVQMKNKFNQWVPLNISEYDTDDTNITINGIIAALKTFAKETPNINSPVKTTGGAPSYRDRDDDDDYDYDYDDTTSPQIIKDGQITTIIYKNLVYTLDPNEKWIKENYFQLNDDGDSITRMRKLRLDDKNIMMQIKDIII